MNFENNLNSKLEKESIGSLMRDELLESLKNDDLDYILKLLNSGNYAGAYVILNKYPCCIKIIDDDKKFE